MNHIQRRQLLSQLVHQLAQQLFTLRDALTHLSLHDLNFEVDVLQRCDATEMVAAHIASSQNRNWQS